ncbi:hypothetical protein [Meiothermus rufus]|uniref:hypothetical protein n=1 Tax=Meiothermus rufus TaxID=604332 RepID=UPI0012EB7CD5|nr:hypothetical protein [Meiothermus rufus]
MKIDQAFLEINDNLKRKFETSSDMWSGSPFAWIRSKPSRQVGKIGERLVEQWLTVKGFSVRPSMNSSFDRFVGNVKLEIKFSTLWEGGFYKFQQLRNQDYDAVFCLGVSPHEVHGWVIPKSIAWEKSDGQHKGKEALDTKWLTVYPDKVEDWLRPYGGNLYEVETALRKLLSE